MTALVIAAAVCAALALGWILLSLRHPVGAVLTLIVYVCISPHLLALLLQAGAPVSALRGALAAKDVLSWLLLLTLLMMRRHEARARWTAFAVVGVAVAMLLSWHGHATLESRAVSARDAAVPWVAAATAVLLTAAERRRAASAAQWIIGAAAIYAIIEYTLPVTVLTKSINVGTYWSAVKHQQGFLVYRPSASGALPGNLFTSGGTRRLSGAFGDPLAAGYILAAAFALCLAGLRRSWYRFANFAIITAALILTFTRAGWITAALSTVGWLLFRGRRKGTYAIAISVIVGLVLLLTMTPIGAYLHGVVSGTDSSTLSHAQSLQGNLHRHYTLWGSGLGGTGAAAAAKGDVVGAIATESVFVTMLLEFGLLLGGLIVGAAMATFVTASRLAWRHPQRRVWVGAAIGLLVTCLLSEELISFNGGWVPVLLVAMGLAGIDDGTGTDPAGTAMPEGAQSPTRAVLHSPPAGTPTVR